jgi:hypothetical protein
MQHNEQSTNKQQNAVLNLMLIGIFKLKESEVTRNGVLLLTY